MRTASDFAVEAVEDGESPTEYLEGMTKAELAYTATEIADLAGVPLEGWDAAEYEEAAATSGTVNIGQAELAGLVEAFAAVANRSE